VYMSLPPLLLERRLDTRIWGGTTLGPWLGLSEIPPQLAESWQVYAQNRIISGAYAGQTLAQLAKAHGADLVGTISFARSAGEFPLLAKFLDAADPLSIQVHPNDSYAHTVEAATGFHGKTEAWYILHAEPGAAVYHGLQQAANRHDVADAIANDTVLDLLRLVPVQTGDTIFVPAGTVHAINAGIMLFEIQQTSDLTYRVYDYNRRDALGKLRELHIEKSLDVIDYATTGPAIVPPVILGESRQRLVACSYFVMDRWQIGDPIITSTSPASFEILTVVEGIVRLTSTHGELHLRRGESCVLPANLGEYTLAGHPEAVVLACSVPEP
jgi:mannose-6-phosphate isomerase